MDHHAKNPFKRYWIQCSILFTAYLAMIMYLLFFHRTTYSFILCILLLLPIKMLVNLFANKNFIGILTNELDAQKFYDTIHHKYMRPPLLYRLNAEWYMGNYEELMILAKAELRVTKRLPVKCVCLVYLARAYFELRDVENLDKIVQEFFKLQKENPQKQKLFSRYPVFYDYMAYLSKDFEQCLSLVEDRMKAVNTGRFGGNLLLFTQRSNCAIAYYELGDLQKAKEIFENIHQTAPKLRNFNHLSTKYLTAIENGDDTALSPVIYRVNTAEYEQKILFVKKKRKVFALIWWMCVVLLLGSFIVPEYTRHQEKTRQEQEYKADEVERFEKGSTPLCPHITEKTHRQV